MMSSQQWQEALRNLWAEVQRSSIQGNTYYSMDGLNDHHGCPPNLDDPSRSATPWDGQPILWSSPAQFPLGLLDVPVSGPVPVACMGTMFWLVAWALKRAGYESAITVPRWRTWKAASITDPVDGFCRSFLWDGVVVTHDPRSLKLGDLLGIRRHGQIHHWCVAWESDTGSVITSPDGNGVIWTLGASPGAQGLGVDWYRLEKEGRDFVGLVL